MPINVLLCRWIGGWREVRNEASIAIYGRREALMGLGALQSPQEVDRVAGEQLGIFADQRTAIAADLAPMGIADRPYRSWNVADTIIVPAYGGGTISQRVRALTGAEDDNGEITYSPELGDLILETQERHEMALKKMADGTVDGQSPVATPVAQTQQAQKVYGGAPFPPAGKKFITGADDIGPNQNGASEVVSGGDGGITYTMASFVVDVPACHEPGLETYFSLVSRPPPEVGGNRVIAELHLGTDYEAGTYVGVITDPRLTTTGGVEWYITGYGQFSGPFKVTVTVTVPGPDVVLVWIPDPAPGVTL